MKYIPIIIFFLGFLNINAQTTTANLNFNSQQPISPYIFGYNQDHEAPNASEKWAIHRLGGNRLTAFNWENGASNSGKAAYTNDDRVPTLIGVPNADRDKSGEAYRVFHANNAAANVQSIITLPIQGNVSADKLGAVTTSPPSSRWRTVVYKKNAPFTLTPDVNDGFVYLDESVNFLVQTFGNASTSGGVKYIALDNEPAYWDGTHQIIQPTQIGVAAYVQKVIDAAKAVKAVDPNVKIIAGEFAGNNIFDFGNAPDWATEKGTHTWFISYFLQKMKQASDVAGYNLIDVLSVHFYPKHEVDVNGNYSSTGTVVIDATATDSYIRSTRMSFTRSLWDETYIEPSFLSYANSSAKLKFGGTTVQPHKLLVRLQESINTYYPGIKIMLGEFDYGGDDDVAHGIGMADFLGVAAAKSVEIATRWDLTTSPPSNTTSTVSKTPNNYTGSAYRLFRNFDGSNATYGNIAIGSTFNNADKSSVWASIDGDDGDLHLILLNKDITNSRNFIVNLNQNTHNYTVLSVHGFDAANTAITSRTHNAVINNGQLTIALPNLSAYHVVLKRNNIVPLDLLSFDAKMVNNAAHLSWQTANEDKVDYFEVEKSANGKVFTPLSKTPAKNVPSQNYSAVDEKPFADVSYYRLKMVDIDGRFTYSAIKSVVFEENKKHHVRIYPNPTSDKLTIEFTAEQEEVVEFELINTNGQIAHTDKLACRVGSNSILFNTSRFPEGLYALRIKQGKTVSVEKIVID
jgi:hypothetical protein